MAFAAALMGLLGPAAGPALAAPAAAISSIEGAQFSGVVDTVNCFGSPGRIQNPSINWGDGTAPSGGTVATAGPNATTCSISGTHTYAEEGSYSTTVTYNNGANSDTGSATVGDAQPNANSGSALSGTAGQTVGGVVATFSDPAPEPLGSYSATIDWGDGSSGLGSVGSGFTVSGSHTYVYGGRYQVKVTIHDEGGAVATAQTTASVSGCPTAAPSSPSPSYTPPAGSPDARYVEALFHDLLGRSAGGFEVSAFTSALADGASRYQIALSILQSGEYRQDLLGQLYSRYLTTPLDAPTASYLNGLLQSGASDEQLATVVLGSGAFFSGPGGGSTDGFLGALYCHALFRGIDPGAQSADAAALGSGTTRTTIASGLLGSTEYLSQQVAGYFLRFLRHPAPPGGLQYFVNLMHSGGSDEQVIASLVSSQEYYAMFNPALRAITAVTAQGIIHAVLPQRARVTLTVLHVLHGARDTGVSPVLAPRTHRVGVVNFGTHRKGRVTLRWNRKVGRHRLAPGTYVLLLRAYHGRKLIFTSDALPFKVR